MQFVFKHPAFLNLILSFSISYYFQLFNWYLYCQLSNLIVFLYARMSNKINKLVRKFYAHAWKTRFLLQKKILNFLSTFTGNLIKIQKKENNCGNIKKNSLNKTIKYDQTKKVSAFLLNYLLFRSKTQQNKTTYLWAELKTQISVHRHRHRIYAHIWLCTVKN